MSYSEELVNRVRETLQDLPDVEEKKMFKGLTFMVNGKMCVGVSKDRLMCRIDPEIHDEAVEKPGCTTVTMARKPYKGFVYVDESEVKSQKDLDYWIGLALEYNPRAKATAKKKS
jgi:TfoX/Sxy family transcriptional regulator of competence genes